MQPTRECDLVLVMVLNSSMWMRFLLALLLASASVIAAPPVGTKDPVKLDAVTVHLFLEKSGQLSPDITSMNSFSCRNFAPSGDGLPEGERFHSFLIKLAFSAPKESFSGATVAVVKLINNKTRKVILSRTIRNLYVGPNKQSFVGIFVEEGHECDNMTVDVVSSDQKIVKEIPFTCGE